MAEEGKKELGEGMQIFLDNKNYASITFQVNYLAFRNLATGNTDFTIAQGNIIPAKVLTASGGSIPI
ncbi:hypothetical protein FC756_22420 [Lysinibacillus mangiferihumi]|uniref:Uncharacterized protein n=1 Tax=Lysinibacillus mangiferihumi TaxID=1130819 RepID=A0A4U2Y0C4_9BACI|nr:hypothetical protein [Lysinibacillus mangiferihumi]TKI53788.1 hypothetical protein FC756_22420 [Lysinibacillus mangiferihumi]